MDPFRRYLGEIERLRPSGRLPENLVVLPRVDSTNRLARAIVDEYAAEEQPLGPLLVLALEQTGGRGRQGRSWSSPPGKGVYASRVLAVDDASQLQGLPLLAGIGLCRTLDRWLPSPCRLKWPNDLLVETAGQAKKIGGILIEAAAQTGAPALAIIGFGINHGQEAGELPETGTSFHLLSVESAVSLEELTWSLVEGIERELVHLGDMAYAAAAWRERAIHRPGDPLVCRLADRTVEGTFAGIDDQGRLVLRTDGGEMRISSGEVIG